MFEILYRILQTNEDLEELDETSFDMGGDVLGFFAINVNGYHHGHYHNYPLQPSEFWSEEISYWFISLIRAFHELNHSGYVLVNEVDSFNTWIELKKIQDMVTVNLIKAEKPCGTTESTDLRLTPLEKFEYSAWYVEYVKDGKACSELVDRRDESVKLSRFRAELLRKASQYLDELREINPKLLGNRIIAELEMLVQSLNNQNKPSDDCE